jgi:Crinkler effector protein N-terminal domain
MTNSMAPNPPVTFCSSQMIKLWCYTEGRRDVFSISISPDRIIDDLKKQIYDEQVKSIVGCGSARLTLTKVRYMMISMRTLM